MSTTYTLIIMTHMISIRKSLTSVAAPAIAHCSCRRMRRTHRIWVKVPHNDQHQCAILHHDSALTSSCHYPTHQCRVTLEPTHRWGTQATCTVLDVGLGTEQKGMQMQCAVGMWLKSAQQCSKPVWFGSSQQPRWMNQDDQGALGERREVEHVWPFSRL